MLNIVIVGAGSVGRHIAATLSRDMHNITLIDINRTLLEEASWNLDVAIRHGSGTDWQLLDDLRDTSPNVLLALTDDDEVNFVSCAIAKHLGYPRTIARVKDERYLNRTRLDFARIFDVDYFIGPDLLVANDILKYMLSSGAVAVEHFAHGAVEMRTIVIPEKWKRDSVPIRHLDLPKGLIVGLIARKREDKRSGGGSGMRSVIFPHGDDVIRAGDEVTFIGEKRIVESVQTFFGLQPHHIKSVVIGGGSLTAVHLARLLKPRGTDVKIIEEDYQRCCQLAEQLPDATIIHHNLTDLDFMKAEKIGDADMFVACTDDDQVNFLAALLGKEAGCQDAMMVMSNMNYALLAARLGINHTVSPRLSAANHILSQILSGKVTSLISLYDNQAEIMEVSVSLDSKLVGIPLSELGPLLPNDFLIAMIQNRGRIMAAHGNRIISPGDTVIVITSPKQIHELETIF